MRINRDPSFDLQRHIITGETGPLSGDPTIQQFDQELDRNDPMDPMTAMAGDNFIVPRSAAEVDAANHAQAAGLGGNWGAGFHEQVDLNGDNNTSQPGTGSDIRYGNRHTGRG